MAARHARVLSCVMPAVKPRSPGLLKSRDHAAAAFTMTDTNLIAQLDALLPQTQCRQCGFRGCRPYAEAMADGAAGANQCPPGGDEVARALATVLGSVYQPVDPRFGVHKPATLANIDEANCIGCTLCINACPVDAIVGAAKLMHTVIAESCTGCELCLPPCPVDCIVLTVRQPAPDSARQRADDARRRFDAREQRLARQRAESEKDITLKAEAHRKKRAVAGALERAQRRMALARPR